MLTVNTVLSEDTGNCRSRPLAWQSVTRGRRGGRAGTWSAATCSLASPPACPGHCAHVPPAHCWVCVESLEGQSTPSILSCYTKGPVPRHWLQVTTAASGWAGPYSQEPCRGIGRLPTGHPRCRTRPPRSVPAYVGWTALAVTAQDRESIRFHCPPAGENITQSPPGSHLHMRLQFPQSSQAPHPHPNLSP